MLRPIEKNDLGKVLEWRNAPEVRNNMYTTHVITEDEHLQWFSRVQQDPSLFYFICKMDRQDAGVICFTDYNPTRGNSSWGFYAALEPPKGAGIFMEYEALKYAFETLKLHKLNCEVIIYNKSVINLHKKTGFVEEGVLRDFHFDGEIYQDVVRLGMLESEWPTAKAKLEKRLSLLA